MHVSRFGRGHVLIPLVASLLLLSSSLGATFDSGSWPAEQQAVQNAANSAAIAGARAVAAWTDSNSSVTAMPDVLGAVDAEIWWTEPDVSCSYVDDSGTALAACDAAVPANATGVQVDASETHMTFFSWLLHHPKYVTTQASAVAHVQMITPDGSGTPFILCGIDTTLASGGTMSAIQQQNSQWAINSAAYGQTFEISGPTVSRCGFPSTAFKGGAVPSANEGKTTGEWFDISIGDAVAPLLDTVDAPGGCQAGAGLSFPCIMFLPIATNNPIPSNSQFYVVDFAPFMVTPCEANCIQGTLIPRLLMNTPDNPPAWVPGTWSRGDNGVFIARLTS